MGAKVKFERFFAEIPVYRCSEDVHYTQTSRKTNDHLTGDYWINHQIDRSKREGKPYDEGQLRREANLFYRISPQNEELFRVAYEERNCFQWQYNQVIGWLRLYVLETQIRGKYYFLKAKRIDLHMKNKCHLDMGKAFELSVYPSQSSGEIYKLVLDEIATLNQERPFKGRYIDLECFEEVGQYIDWRGLLGYS